MAIRDEEPRTATSTFTRLLSAELLKVLQVPCCFTSTETIKTIRDGKLRTVTSTFTQLLRSELLTSYEFSIALRPQRPFGLLFIRDGEPRRPPRLSRSS